MISNVFKCNGCDPKYLTDRRKLRCIVQSLSSHTQVLYTSAHTDYSRKIINYNIIVIKIGLTSIIKSLTKDVAAFFWPISCLLDVVEWYIVTELLGKIKLQTLHGHMDKGVS